LRHQQILKATTKRFNDLWGDCVFRFWTQITKVLFLPQIRLQSYGKAVDFIWNTQIYSNLTVLWKYLAPYRSQIHQRNMVLLLCKIFFFLNYHWRCSLRSLNFLFKLNISWVLFFKSSVTQCRSIRIQNFSSVSVGFLLSDLK
jgi:hypothetical protein